MGKGSGSGRGASRSDSSLQTVMTGGAERIRPKGLQNVGNTCYANATLQCLLSTALSHALLEPEKAAIFRRFSSNPNLLQLQNGSSKQEDAEMETSRWLRRELTHIIREYAEKRPPTNGSMLSMAPNSPGVVNPGSITKHPDRLSKCLTPYQQEDAHEFLRAFLSTLTMNGHYSHLSSLFDGLLESAITCQVCYNSSLTRDRYMDLSLDIARANTLQEALEEFTMQELLGGDNKVFCEQCQCKQPVKKGLRLATAPSILVCHLKRFAFDKYGRMVRLANFVRFPQRLEIGDYMSLLNQGKPPMYELVGVLVHQGRTCDRGHYLAYIKSGRDWYMANDAIVKKVDTEVVLRQQAYILMYEVAGMRSAPPKSTTNNKKQEDSITSCASWISSDQEGWNDEHPTIAAPAPDRSLWSLFMSSLCGDTGNDDTIIHDFCCGSVSSTEDNNPSEGITGVARATATTREGRRMRRSNSSGNLRRIEDEANRIYKADNAAKNSNEDMATRAKRSQSTPRKSRGSRSTGSRHRRHRRRHSITSRKQPKQPAAPS